jgi:hypothetical protein
MLKAAAKGASPRRCKASLRLCQWWASQTFIR